MAKILLSDISKQYIVKRKPVDALKNVSFEVSDAAFLLLTGPSGSGKSTILQLISGIEQPTSGQILINDQDITKMPNRKLTDFRRQTIGIVFQQFYLEPTLNLRQNIELPAMFAKQSSEFRKQRTAELAELMGLQEVLDHLPSELSGGQIQRGAVARAIYNKPAILIADEPTSNLDSENVNAIINLFKQVQQAYGTTIIIASHDQNLAPYASQTVKLDHGSIAL